MDSVNDLNPTNITKGTPTQTVSLNTLRGSSNTPTSSININTTNGGVTGVAEGAANNRPTIRINPNRKKPMRRTIEDPSQVESVNPSDFIQKPQNNTPTRAMSIQQKSISMLDNAIERKKQEYIDFVNSATEADKYNRERVEEGFEKVDGEINYMPNDFKQPANEKISNDDDIDNFDNDEEDVNSYEREIDETINESSEINTTAVISDPFAIDEEDMKDLNDEEETATNNDESLSESTYQVNNAPKAYFDRPEDLPSQESYLNSTQSEVVEDVEEEKQAEEEIEPEIAKEVEKPTTDNTTAIDKRDSDIIDNIAAKSIKVSSQVIPTGKEDLSNSSSSDFNVNEDDFEDLTYEGANEEQLTDDQIRKIAEDSEKHLKNEILIKIIQAGKKLDTSSFVVSNKVISIKDALRNAPVSTRERIGEWPMMYSGRPFRASALKGPDIALLFENDDSERSDGSGIGITNQQIRIIYEHDANPYKPKTVEGWAKTIPFADIESIFAALYVASLKGANYIPMACSKPSCMYSYLSDNTDINKLIKFGNDESKKKFEEIKHTSITPENTGKYESVVNVINDNYAIGLKVPSIFTILYEYAALNPAFARKYSTVTNIMQYVDYIYKINPVTQSFEPIGWKAYPGDNGKTFKSKIATYAKILKDFDDTDFSVLIALINSMVSKLTETRQITYEIPAAKCPKCGSDIEARSMSPRMLLFTRQRLVGLATTPSGR